jgi:integrase
MRRYIIEGFRNAHGDKPVNRLIRGHVKDIIGAKADTPHAANSLLKMLRVLLGFGVSIEMIENNPAIGVKKYKTGGGGVHSWTESEIAQFEQRHPIGTRARLAFALLLYTAQRRADVTKMGWQQICATPHGDAIMVRQEKTDTPLAIPIHPDLARVLASAFASDVFGDRARRTVHACRVRQLVPRLL